MAGVNGGFEFILAGVPVRVQWFFFVTAALLGSNLINDPIMFAVWVAVVFISVLLHEMGHAAVYRAFGVQPRIMLQGFGGLTFGRSLPPGKDFLVSIAGPGTNLLIAFSALYASTLRIDPQVSSVLGMIGAINVVWAIFNILPIMPLDGGNATNSFLSLIFRRDMTPAARTISVITGGVVIFFLIRIQFVLPALFIGFFVWQNLQGLTGQRGPSPFRPTVINAPKQKRFGRGRVSSPRPPAAPPTRPVDAPPGPQRGSSPIDTTGWQMPTKRRTFEQEITTAVDALSSDAPELASIAVDRARRLAENPEQHAVADQVQAEILRRISG